MRISSIVLAGLLVLSGCATPQTSRPDIVSSEVAEEQRRQSLYALESRAADYRRVYDIATQITSANVELCARTRPSLGMRIETIGDYPRDFREAAGELWGLSGTPKIQWMTPGSPAAAAGLQVGDQIVAINGRQTAAGTRSSRQAWNMLRDAAGDGPVNLSVRRSQESLEFSVTPQPDCAYQFVVVEGDDVNAWADGKNIVIPRGMLRFVRSDEELALVLGHELAHNAMGHIDAMMQNAAMGAIGGAVLDVLAAAAGVNTGGAFSDAGGDIGRMMFAQAFEAEADYVGMYFLARADYSLEGVEDFWRRMAAESPGAIRLAYTHPNTAERFLRLQAASAEIAQKVAEGVELRPNMRERGGAN